MFRFTFEGKYISLLGSVLVLVRWEFWLWHNMPLIHLLYFDSLVASCTSTHVNKKHLYINSYFHLFSHRDCPGKPKKGETCASHPVQARGQALPDILWGKYPQTSRMTTIAMLPNYINLTLSCLLLVIVIMSSYVIHILLRNSPTSMALQNSFKLGSIFFIASQEASPDVASLTPLLTNGSYVEGRSSYTYHMVSHRILSYRHDIYIWIHMITYVSTVYTREIANYESLHQPDSTNPLSQSFPLPVVR